MTHYFFHVYNGTGLTQDQEGLELADLAAARQVALTGIRSLLGEDLESGLVDLNGRLDICGREGTVLLSVPFSEAIELRIPDGDEP